MRIARIAVGSTSSVVVMDGEDHGRDLAALGIDTVARALGELVAGSLPARLGACPRVAVTPSMLRAPVDEATRILCAGFNYAAHATETGRERPAKPNFFQRYPSSFVGAREAIAVPPVSEQLDWEGEIAFVVGRGGKAIARSHAHRHVGGYVVLGDHSVRDFQFHGSQASAGKNFDRTGAIGPWIVTPDELDGDLEVRTFLGDEQVQHGRLSQLLFDVPALVAYVSMFMELRPGDVIATGTPPGVGARRTPPRWLRPGDEIAVEVPGIGRIANPIVRAEGP